MSVTARISAPAGTKFVYAFSEGSKEMGELLGGKGANIAEMTRIGGPVRVPEGFTITAEACVEYMKGSGRFPEGLDEQLADALSRLEAQSGKRFGDPDEPLLVSVRSGARISMPGMMDTVLNLGLNDTSVEGLARKTGNRRFAWDSYRRFVQMFANVVRDIDGALFEDAIKEKKREKGATLDTHLEPEDLEALTATFKRIFGERTREDFPQDPRE
jgi:pyruvate, orthophosphate dikinase